MFVESANSAYTQITISLSVKYHATGLITANLTFHSSFILSFHQEMKILILFALVAVASSVSDLKCFYQKEFHNKGDVWVSKKNFKVKCVADDSQWEVKIVACRTEKGSEIPVGGTLTEGDKVYTCTKRGKYVDIKWSSN